MTALTVTLYVLAALVLVVCVLKNMFRSTLRSSVNLGATALCAVLAFFLGRSLAGRVGAALSAALLGGQAELAASLPSLRETAAAVGEMLAAPLTFTLCFVGLQIVVAIICAIVLHVVERPRPDVTGKTRAIGAPLAIVSALLIIVVCFLPLAGFSSYLPDILASSTELTDAPEGTLTAEDAAALAAHPVLATSRTLGGRAVFDGLARATVLGMPTTLDREYRTVMALLEDVALLAVPMEEYGDTQEAAMLALADHAEASPIVRTLGAEAAKGFSAAWLDGKPFLGVEQPDLGLGMNLALEAVMIVMEQTTPETFPADLRALTPAFFTAIETVYTIEDISDSSSFSVEDLQTVIDVIADGTASEATREALIRAGIGLAAKELADFVKPAEPSTPSGGDEIVLPDDEIVVDLPGENDVTEEEYNRFVRELTDVVVAGALTGDRDALVAEVKDLRDASGLNISDEECEQLIDNVLSGPFGSLFGR